MKVKARAKVLTGGKIETGPKSKRDKLVDGKVLRRKHTVKPL